MNTRSFVRLFSAVCFVVPVALAGQSNEAVACGESIAFEVDPNVLLLSQAETSLSGGKARSAALDAIKARGASDDRIRLKEYEDLVMERVTVHAFYVKYLLPIYFDVQCLEYVPGTEPANRWVFARG